MSDFSQHVIDLKNIADTIDNDFEPTLIEQTAARLEGLNYSPPVITPISRFLRMDRQAVREEIDRILTMPDQEACALAPDSTQHCEDIRLEYIRVMLFYYKKLVLLRQGNTEEWDEIDELYVHD